MTKTLCLIPARKGSKGLKNKNKIGRAHVRTPVTEKSRMPSSA